MLGQGRSSQIWLITFLNSKGLVRLHGTLFLQSINSVGILVMIIVTTIHLEAKLLTNSLPKLLRPNLCQILVLLLTRKLKSLEFLLPFQYAYLRKFWGNQNSLVKKRKKTNIYKQSALKTVVCSSSKSKCFRYFET